MPILNMYPHPTAIAELLIELVKAWEWNGFTILYESPSWLPRVTELLEFYDVEGFTVTVRQINVGLTNNNYRPMLRRVKLSEETHIVLECSIEILPEVLKQVIFG